MAINITITAENGAQAAQQLAEMLRSFIGYAAAKPIAAPAAVAANPMPPSVDVKVDVPAVEAPAPEAPKVERKKRTKKEAAPAVEQPQADEEPEADESDDNENIAQITRQDLVDIIKHLHKSQGDPVLEKVKGVLTKYGAKMQSEVKEDDLADVVSELTALAKKAG